MSSNDNNNNNNNNNNNKDSLLVLVTGASGFIAKHTIRQLLEAGYTVRGTVRNDEEETIAQKAVATYYNNNNNNKFSLVRADLLDDDGNAWTNAVKDCTFVLHLASPYPSPLEPPIRDREGLVQVSKEGALRVIRASLAEPSVQHIVMVSSIVAVMYWPNRPTPVVQLKESDWTDPDWDAMTWAYAIAKTRAEKAAWELVKQEHAEDKFTTVNPAMVWGPLFDDVQCASSDMCKLFLNGAYPFNVPISYPVVDVRDLAALLVATVDTTTSSSSSQKKIGGRRLFASGGTVSFTDMAQCLLEQFPQYQSRIPTWLAPKWLIQFIAWFDPQLKQIVPDLETIPEMDATYVTELLPGVTFRPPTEAVLALAKSIVERKLVE